jgi:hypothetical protein
VTTELIDPTTNTSYRYNMTSFVPDTGGPFFTGDGALATRDDPWTTKVTVPSNYTVPTTATTYTSASLFEELRLTSCEYPTCYSSQLTIPGTFAKLQIQIFWDKSASNGVNPDRAKLYYTGSNGAISYPIQLQLCSADAITYGPAPSFGRPCFSALPIRIPNNSPDWPRAAWQDILFSIEAVDNGKYEN